MYLEIFPSVFALEYIIESQLCVHGRKKRYKLTTVDNILSLYVQELIWQLPLADTVEVQNFITGRNFEITKPFNFTDEKIDLEG